MEQHPNLHLDPREVCESSVTSFGDFGWVQTLLLSREMWVWTEENRVSGIGYL